jgi:hypothetical protein
VEIEVTETGEHAATSAARHRVGRRALLGVGVGGAALSLLPFLSGQAGASATTDESTTTSSTTPPQRPTDDDVTLLAFAQQLEATATALYNEALGVKGWSDAQAPVITFIRDAHLAYAQALSGLLGRLAPNEISQELFDSLKADFGGSVEGALAAAGAFESSAVATHLDILAKLQGTDGGALIASMQSNEARFCTVVADLAGESDLAVLLVDEENVSLVGKG